MTCPCDLPLCAKGCARELGDSDFDPPTDAAIDTAQALMLVMRELDHMVADSCGGIGVYFDGRIGAALEITRDGKIEIRDWQGYNVARRWRWRKEAG